MPGSMQLLQDQSETLPDVNYRGTAPQHAFGIPYTAPPPAHEQHDERGTKKTKLIRRLRKARHANRVAQSKLNLKDEEIYVLERTLSMQAKSSHGLQQWLTRRTDQVIVKTEQLEDLDAEMMTIKTVMKEMTKQIITLEKRNAELVKAVKSSERRRRNIESYATEVAIQVAEQLLVGGKFRDDILPVMEANTRALE